MNKRKLYKEIKSSISIIEDPLYQLISDFEDIKYIYSNYSKLNKKIFYFSKENIHIILYNSEEVIDLNEEEILSNISDNLSELFYLSLLVINDTQYEYTYSIKYIENIYNYLKENKNSIKIYKKLVILKIIDFLIINFKNFVENEEEISLIEEELKNKDIMEKNLLLFNKEFNLNFSYDYFYQIKIDVIYVEIIISLIKNKKFSEYEYCKEIIEQINLDKINITKTIYDKLKEVLNKNNDYMKKYNINETKDLLDQTKINFYYILIISILKDIFYIYNIDFLYDNFINLKKLLRKKLEINFNNDNKIIEKIGKLIQFLKIPKNIFHENNKKIFELLDKTKLNATIIDKDESTSTIQVNNSSYFKDCLEKREENDYNRKFPESSSKSSLFSIIGKDNNFSNSKLNDDKIENIDKEIAEEILTKLEFQINIDLKGNRKEYYYNNIIYGKNDKKIFDIKDLKRNYNYNDMNYKNKSEELIYQNYIKLLGFLKDIEDYIEKSNIKYNNSEILFQLKKEEKEINKDNNKDIFYINCIYIFCLYYKKQKYTLKFKDENILVNSIDSKLKGFIFLINELSNDDYISINKEKNLHILEE